MIKYLPHKHTSKLFFTTFTHMKTKSKKTTVKKEAKQHYSARFTPSLIERLRKRAADERRNVNNLIEYILEENV